MSLFSDNIVNKPKHIFYNSEEAKEIWAVYSKLAGKIHKHGRNSPCLCNSGKKYKKCCLPIFDKFKQQVILAKRSQARITEEVQERERTDIFARSEGRDKNYHQQHLKKEYGDDSHS